MTTYYDEKHKQYIDAWRAKNREKVNAYSREKNKEYYQKNREAILARRKELRDAKKANSSKIDLPSSPS
jgi:hypothetical protein